MQSPGPTDVPFKYAGWAVDFDGGPEGARFTCEEESGSSAEQPRRAVGWISRSRLICSTRGRISIFERWESHAARATFRSSGLDKEQRATMLTVAVQEYIADVRPVFGERHSMSCSTDRAMTDEIGPAVRSYRTTTKPTRRDRRP